MPPAHRLFSLLPRIPLRTHATSAPSSVLTVDSARADCTSILRTSDHASHLNTPFLHPQARDAHLAIRAFNISTALIDSSVSNTAVGRIRIQFWRDLIDKIYTGSPASPEPVGTLLAKVLNEDCAPLSKHFFRKILSAREQYLGSAPFATLADLEQYAENTYGSLQYLSLESYYMKSTALDHIGSHIGKASGIAATLRGIPVVASSSAVVLPLDVLAEFDTRQEDVICQGPTAPGLKDVVFKIATLANDHLITARKMLKDTGRDATGGAFTTFLPAVSTSLYLEKLEKANFDPFKPELQKGAWTLPWRTYRAFKTKTF